MTQFSQIDRPHVVQLLKSPRRIVFIDPIEKKSMPIVLGDIVIAFKKIAGAKFPDSPPKKTKMVRGAGTAAPLCSFSSLAPCRFSNLVMWASLTVPAIFRGLQ